MVLRRLFQVFHHVWLPLSAGFQGAVRRPVLAFRLSTQYPLRSFGQQWVMPRKPNVPSLFSALVVRGGRLKLTACVFLDGWSIRSTQNYMNSITAFTHLDATLTDNNNRLPRSVEFNGYSIFKRLYFAATNGDVASIPCIYKKFINPL